MPKPRTLTLEQAAEAARLYQEGWSLDRLAAHFNVESNRSFTRWFKEFGVPMRGAGPYRTHTLDESVFDTLTEESLWALGFIVADGCVYEHEKRCVQKIRITVRVEDRGILDWFQSFFKTTIPVRESVTSSFDNETHRIASIEIHSKRLVAALKQYGIGPRKSMDCEVSESLVCEPAFLRGLIDGDGSLYSCAGWPAIQLVGARNLLEQVARVVGNHLEGNPVVVRPFKSIWRLQVYCKRAVKLTKWLYGDASISLPRKLEIAKEFMRFTSTSKLT